MLFNNRKYYIPGETQENARLRERASDLGIVIIMVNTYLFSNNPDLKTNINGDFMEKIGEIDIDYHF